MFSVADRQEKKPTPSFKQLRCMFSRFARRHMRCHEKDCNSCPHIPISESVPYSGKPKECCGGVAVEQEKLRGLWVSAFGALTPVSCFLVLLTLIPEDQSDVVIGCDNEV